MNASQITRVTATGDVTTADAYLRAVVLTSGAADATATVKAGGASGTTVLVLAVEATAATSVVSGDLHDAYMAGGVHVTLAGTGAEVAVVFA